MAGRLIAEDVRKRAGNQLARAVPLGTIMCIMETVQHIGHIHAYLLARWRRIWAVFRRVKA